MLRNNYREDGLLGTGSWLSLLPNSTIRSTQAAPRRHSKARSTPNRQGRAACLASFIQGPGDLGTPHAGIQRRLRTSFPYRFPGAICVSNDIIFYSFLIIWCSLTTCNFSFIFVSSLCFLPVKHLRVVSWQNAYVFLSGLWVLYQV